MSVQTLYDWLKHCEETTGEPIVALSMCCNKQDLYEGVAHGSIYKNNLSGIDSLSNTRPMILIKRHFDSGFGSSECPPFIAWTKSWVLFHHVHDGSDHIAKVPRNPCDMVVTVGD
jgi:hypothetical protein